MLYKECLRSPIPQSHCTVQTTSKYDNLSRCTLSGLFQFAGMQPLR